MALYREKAEAVLVKIETTSGTDSVPTGVNVVRTKGVPEIVVDFMDPGDRGDVVTGILSGADDAAAVGMYGTIDLVLEMKGLVTAFAAGNRPEADALLRMCGLSATVDTTASAELVRYATLDASMETGTVYVYAAGKLFKLLGAVANVKGAAEVYKTGTLTFSVKGKLAALPTEVAVPSLTFLQVIPQGFHSAAAQIGTPAGTWASGDATDPLMLQTASFDLGNVMPDLPSAGANDGLAGFMVTDRAPTQELSMFVSPLTKFSAWNAAQADGFAWGLTTAWQVGQAQYNRVKVEARWKARSPRLGNKNSVKLYTVGGPLRVGSSGISPSGRELQITFY